jgi:hypothetical protein
LWPNVGSPLLLPGFSSPLTRTWPTPALARSRARAEAHPGPDPVAAGQDAEAGRPCRARHGLSLSRPIKAGRPLAPRPSQLRRPSPAPAQKPPPPCCSLSRTARIWPAPLTSNPAGSIRNPPTVSAPRDSPCSPRPVSALLRPPRRLCRRRHRWTGAPVHGRPPLCPEEEDDSFASNPLRNPENN